MPENWNPYLCSVSGKLASLLVNLGLQQSAELITITLGLIFLMMGCHRGPDMDLTVECVQLQPASTTLNIDAYDSSNNLGRAIHDEVQRMQLRYEVRGFSGGTYLTTGENRPAAHVLLLVPEPVKEAADLPVPQQGGDVVYLLRNGHWQPYPAPVANASSHLIRVRPDGRRDGIFTIDVTGMGSWPTQINLKPS